MTTPVPLEPRARRAPPAALQALLLDLQVLDARLQQVVARLRSSETEPQADGFQGLLIGEDNVDTWLGSLLAAEGHNLYAPGPLPDLAPASPRNPQSALAQLGTRFDLSPFDVQVVLTCLAPELHIAYGGLYAYVQDDVTRKHATVDLALTLWCDTLAERLAARARFHPLAPLRRHRLLALAEDNSPTPLLTHAIALDPRIIAYLLGEDDLDPALIGLAEREYPGPARLAPTPIARPRLADPAPEPDPPPAAIARLAAFVGPVLDSARPWAAAPDEPPGLVVVLEGADGGAKLEAARQLAAALDRPLLRVNGSQLLAAEGAPGLVPRLGAVFREALLDGALLLWQHADALITPDPALVRAQAVVREHLASWPGCVLFDLIHNRVDAWPTPGPVVLRLDFPIPGTDERRQLWEGALGGRVQLGDDVELDLIAGSFRLTRNEILAAAAAARHAAAWHGPGAGVVTMRDLFAACRSHSNQQLGLLARKLQPIYTWRDLVLPADRLAQLREMCNNVRFGPQVYEQWGFDRKLSYGKGVNVLFSGAPGTGKTMAAEVLATDLGLDIYKIDLSTVVSKYIGETEKNLEVIFREGRTSNAILFFDEADSLFGKRSEVKDSHDRYANIETGYLLQKMEEYDGIIILATNLRKNLDEAFVRRLHGAIDFPMPEEEDRLRLWQTMFPAEAPVADDLNLAFLANHFKLSGGNIKNIVVAAAFLAAEEGQPIGMIHLIRATRREFQKIGKLALESDFGPYYALIRLAAT